MGMTVLSTGNFDQSSVRKAGTAAGAACPGAGGATAAAGADGVDCGKPGQDVKEPKSRKTAMPRIIERYFTTGTLRRRYKQAGELQF
jgi:hypothetical protein